MQMDELKLEQDSSGTGATALSRELLEYFPADGLSWPYHRRVHEAYSECFAANDGRRASVEASSLKMLREDLRVAGRTPRERRVAADALSCLEELCAPAVPPRYRARVVRDFTSRRVLGRSDYVLEIHTYSHEPEEMTEELAQHGLHSIQSAHEGCLCLDAEAPPVQPLYPLELGVFESLATR
jgi:hypothetical protein